MKKSKIYLLALLSAPFLSMAQETTKDKSTYFSNALFVILLAAIILLLALIAVLGTTLKNIAKSDYLEQKVKKLAEKTNNAKNIGVIVMLCLLSADMFGQNAKVAKNSWLIGGLDYWTFYIMIGIIACEMAVVATLFVVMKNLLKEEETVKGAVAEVKPKEKTFMDKINASVEIEHEEEIMLTHNYDGIRELDNNLPPWWKYGFYLTIVVAFAYMIHYHVSKTGDLQTEEYNKEVAKGEAEVAQFLKNSASNVDETNVKLLTAESDLNAAKEIFTGICSTCHGKHGEGNSIGPNLTDEYWLHGGALEDVFKTIKYGWPDKGMQSWKDQYSPTQIAQLASFVKSLRGTNPPNAKEKQGELYIDKADSSSLKVDSLQIVPPVDSLKKDIVKRK